MHGFATDCPGEIHRDYVIAIQSGWHRRGFAASLSSASASSKRLSAVQVHPVLRCQLEVHSILATLDNCSSVGMYPTVLGQLRSINTTVLFAFASGVDSDCVTSDLSAAFHF